MRTNLVSHQKICLAILIPIKQIKRLNLTNHNAIKTKPRENSNNYLKKIILKLNIRFNIDKIKKILFQMLSRAYTTNLQNIYLKISQKVKYL